MAGIILARPPSSKLLGYYQMPLRGRNTTARRDLCSSTRAYAPGYCMSPLRGSTRCSTDSAAGGFAVFAFPPDSHITTL